MSVTHLTRLHIPTKRYLRFRYYHHQQSQSPLGYTDVSERCLTWEDHTKHSSKRVIDALMKTLKTTLTWLTPWVFDDATAVNYMYHLSKYFNDAEESTGVIKIAHYHKTEAPFIPDNENLLRIYHENDEGFNAYYLTFAQHPTKEYVNELITSMAKLPEVSNIYISEELFDLIDTPKDKDDYVEFLFERVYPRGPDRVADFAVPIINHLPVSKQVDERSGDVTVTSLYTGNQLILSEQYVKARIRVYEKTWLDSLTFNVINMGGAIQGKAVEEYRQWIEKVKPQ